VLVEDLLMLTPWTMLLLQVRMCAAEVQRVCGEELMFNGTSYPGPQAVTQDQLQQILTEAWDIWGV
jgi:hypothetical protein